MHRGYNVGEARRCRRARWRLQHGGVQRDAGLVLGVRLDERVEDGPLLLEPVLPACSIKGETRGAPQKMILRRRPQDVELRADGVAVVGP